MWTHFIINQKKQHQTGHAYYNSPRFMLFPTLRALHVDLLVLARRAHSIGNMLSL